MLFRRRCLNMTPLLILVGAVLLMTFVAVKIKERYDTQMKYHRLQTYKKHMDEISDYMNAVVRSANKSSVSLQRLNAALRHSLESRATEPAPAPDDAR